MNPPIPKNHLYFTTILGIDYFLTHDGEVWPLDIIKTSRPYYTRVISEMAQNAFRRIEFEEKTIPGYTRHIEQGIERDKIVQAWAEWAKK